MKPTNNHLLDDFTVKVIKNMKSAEFKNKHGERFVLHTNGISVYMSGDEVDMMVHDKHKIAKTYIPLFNPQFGIWSAEELYQLGKALMELHKDER